MPNHIKNKIVLEGALSDLDAMIKKFSTYEKASVRRTYDGEEIVCQKKSDKWGFCWFNPSTGISHNRDEIESHIGIPEGYEIEIYDSVVVFPDFNKVIPAPKEDPAYNDLPNQEEARHSPNWWYNWNTRNWGTKWSGYTYERPAINEFLFETAWCSVPHIIEKMSLEYPNVKIIYTWADEDTGSNCGRSVYQNGLQESFIPDLYSVEAYELAFELRPEYKDNYELVDGEYQYVER